MTYLTHPETDERLARYPHLVELLIASQHVDPQSQRVNPNGYHFQKVQDRPNLVRRCLAKLLFGH